MREEIIRPQDIDQVLFLGENSIQLMEFRLKYPNAGSPDYSTVIYGDPWFIGGIFKKERVAVAIENKRILKQIVSIKGRRTLIILADLDAVDKNRSILDVATLDLQRSVNNLETLKKSLESENLMLHKFVQDQNLEDTWEEWLVNKLELARVMAQKTQKPESGQSVSVEVGDQKKKD